MIKWLLCGYGGYDQWQNLPRETGKNYDKT